MRARPMQRTRAQHDLKEIIMPTAVRWGSDIQLNLNPDGQQSAPVLAGLADGGFVAVWTSKAPTDPDGSVGVQVFNADGTRHGSEYSFTPQSVTVGRDHPVVGLSDGNFELAWSQ